MSGDRPGRSGPERVTFIVSLLILGALVGLISLDLVADERPAAPVATIGETRRAGEQFVVTVTVENTGDRTATDVQVLAELTIGEEVVDGDHVVEYLPGSASEDVEIVLPEDPAKGELKARVTGFQHP